MSAQVHFFQLENQYNAVHFPERPNGFAILIIGDRNHYVEREASLWTQHFGRKYWIDQFVNKGYLVFYSHLYGHHWGAPKAVEYLQTLWQLMLRKYILNNRLHIAAEGMGALTALRLMKENGRTIRSAVFINPCLDLKAHFNEERESRLFYKRLHHELAAAYEADPQTIEKSVISPYDLSKFITSHPVAIWQATDITSYDLASHSRKFEKLRRANGHPIQLTLYVEEKKYAIVPAIQQFFKQNEHHL